MKLKSFVIAKIFCIFICINTKQIQQTHGTHREAAPDEDKHLLF